MLFRRGGVMGCSGVGFLFIHGWVCGVRWGIYIRFFVLRVVVYRVLAMG